MTASRSVLRSIARSTLKLPGSKLLASLLFTHLPYAYLSRLFDLARIPLEGALWEVVDWSIHQRSFDPVAGAQVIRGVPLERVGSPYGGCTIPQGILDRNSVCYCAGVGEDATFDMGLIDRYHCTVVSIDPTPRAKRYITPFLDAYPTLQFSDYGLWNKDESIKFFVPADPAHVSHSALNLQKTDDYFTAKCRMVASMMKLFGHTSVNLLKLDIEGAEYNVVSTLVDAPLDIDIICVAYDEAVHPLDEWYLSRVRSSLRSLLRIGYRIVAVEPRCNYTLLHQRRLH